MIEIRPIPDHANLATLPEGLYDTGDRKVEPEWVDIRNLEVVKNAELRLLLRVCPKGTDRLPCGELLDLCVRPDGVITYKRWDLTPDFRERWNREREEELLRLRHEQEDAWRLHLQSLAQGEE